MKFDSRLPVACLLLALLLLSACSTESKTDSKNASYTDNKFGFQLTYPQSWPSDVHEWKEPTATQEASPDSGIILYVDGNREDNLYIFGQLGTLSVPVVDQQETEPFKTDSGLTGTLSTSTQNGRVEQTLILDGAALTEQAYAGRSLGAHISVGEKAFKQHKDELLSVLASISIKKD
ncbi:hypothetical protein [Gorillibacterium sp. sgz500922]|uniref:hypothetical protein n=1 Tax=Gorillibacterium sp. sgz500922 TaxID=3446694 RepID=UPI003F66AD86